MKKLEYSDNELKILGGYWTAREIHQQPKSWSDTLAILSSKRGTTDAFLQPLLQRENLRIILTGAGTSAFVGSSIAPTLSENLDCRVEAIPTTDLVSNPKQFFKQDIPTLLVSFARSGNSPESVAAMQYADQLVDECYQLAITCNAQGALYKQCTGATKLAVLMPEETNDKSFAMTSSFSSMLLSALNLLGNISEFDDQLNIAIKSTSSILATHATTLKTMANKQFKRVVYLGSGGFKGLAQESALKLLELTDGTACASFDSPLGFRHGPKAIVNDETLVFVFISNDPLTSKYDLDLLRELQQDAEVGQLIAICSRNLEHINAQDCIRIPSMENAEDAFLLLPYIVCAQLYALEYALSLGNTPDNPSSSGTINRVVQGVTTYAI